MQFQTRWFERAAKRNKVNLIPGCTLRRDMYEGVPFAACVVGVVLLEHGITDESNGRTKLFHQLTPIEVAKLQCIENGFEQWEFPGRTVWSHSPLAHPLPYNVQKRYWEIGNKLRKWAT